LQLEEWWGVLDGPGQPRLRLGGISKTFSSLVANDRIDLDVMPSSIHAVLGENGAGKSTLMKIIYGVIEADDGAVIWEGVAQTHLSPARARQLGIGMVFQHFSLFPALTVLENILLFAPKGVTREDLRPTLEAVSAEYGLPVNPDDVVGKLGMGERQRVEIVRCLLQDPKLLILDEPTSVLTPQAAAELFVMLKRLAEGGCSILYISHKLHEVREICDIATVLKGGRVVATVDPRRESEDALARHMLGSIVPPISQDEAVERGPVRVSVSALSRAADVAGGVGLDDISLDVRCGEIFGIAGIAGNGQAELLEALSGEWAGAPAECIRIDGRPAADTGVKARRRAGLVYVPEERLGRGSVPGMALRRNSLLTTSFASFFRCGLIRQGPVDEFTGRCIKEFDVRPADGAASAETLSGGNLQKFIVGRELLQSPAVVIAAQPTWGLDVGAARSIRQLLVDLRTAGVAILLVSEDLDELFAICDRIAVMANGRLSEAKPAASTSVEEIGRLMGGRHADRSRSEPEGNAHAS
jgi:simple sugar transport system ATP-binding protein